MEKKTSGWAKRLGALTLVAALALPAMTVFGASNQGQQGQGSRSARTAREGTTMTLQGNCIKMGVKDSGSLGVGGNTNPGIQYDKLCTGTFSDAYDFLTPGSPYEGVSVVVDDVNYVDNNDYGNLPDASTNRSLEDKSGVAYRGKTWDKRVIQKSETAKFKMENDIHFNANSRFIEITTIITATDAIAELYIGRHIDSDARITSGDSSATNNARGYSTINGKYLVFSETTESEAVMGYYTGKETNVNTGVSRPWSLDSKVYFGGPDAGNGDNTIGIASKYTAVGAGTAVSFTYAYIFGSSAYRAGKMAIDLGLGGGTAGKTPGCTGSAAVCAPKDVGSAVETNTPAPPTATKTLTPSPESTATETVYRSPTSTNTPTNTATFTPTLTPSPIPFLMKKGAVGASFVLGLLQNKTLVSWGMNREYQANIPPCCGSGIDDIAVGTNFALALKGGRVYGWGADTLKQVTIPPAAQKDIVAIAAGGAHGMALTKKGTVVLWGDNKFKQATAPKGLKNVVQLAGGAVHSLALKKDGTVAAWGGNAAGQTKIPVGLKNVVQVAAGLDHSVALKKDKTVSAWGGNSKGQSTVPTNAADMKQVSAGNMFTLAVRNDGTVFGWGDNSFKQLEIPAEFTDIYNASAGYTNTILGLRNGRIIVLGDQSNDVGVSRTPTKTATPTP